MRYASTVRLGAASDENACLRKANDVDPQAYIAGVIAKIADDWPAGRWNELMPWNWSKEPAKLAA